VRQGVNIEGSFVLQKDSPLLEKEIQKAEVVSKRIEANIGAGISNPSNGVLKFWNPTSSPEATIMGGGAP
jgi:hypothetical protein